MIDNALKVVIFMYIMSTSLIAAQFVIADVFNIELVSIYGVPLESKIVDFMDEGNLNQRTVNVVNANFTTNSTFYDRVETFTTGAAFVAWELVQILTGTYIFNVMQLLGVPAQFVTVFVISYTLILARTIIGYVRGI